MRFNAKVVKSIFVPALVGIVLYFVNVSFITWMFRVFPDTVALVFGSGSWWLDAEAYVKVVYVGIVGPVIEEVVFRKLLLGYFVKRGDARIGLLVSTVVFAGYHLLFGWGILKAVIMIVPGIVFGVMFIRYGFRGCLSCHLSNNVLAAAGLLGG